MAISKRVFVDIINKLIHDGKPVKPDPLMTSLTCEADAVIEEMAEVYQIKGRDASVAWLYDQIKE
jgi:hypothetical protein